VNSLVTALSTGDVGFDLALGEQGLLAVRRFEDRQSAIVLVRGSPGAGKSAMALSLALEASKHRGVAVGYACVELLPTELRALAEGLWASAVRFVDRHSAGVAREIVTQSVDAARTLESLAEQLDQLVERSAPSGSPVLVIDSLLRGSALGSEASRDLVDAVCKFAVEKGAVLILVEESLGGPSPWMWSVDTVIELSNPIGIDDTGERVLTIPKHRFGPCDAGPHRWIFNQRGIEVFPRAAAYTRPWAPAVGPPATGWLLEGAGGHRWEIHGSQGAQTFAVSGQSAHAAKVRRLATSLVTEHGAKRLHLRLFAGRSTDTDDQRSVMRSEHSVEREFARVSQLIEETKASIIVLGDVALLAPLDRAVVSQWLVFLEAIRRRGRFVVAYQTSFVGAPVDTPSQFVFQSDLLIDAKQSNLNFAPKTEDISDGTLVTEVRGVRSGHIQELKR
jgi:KaiC/GvpD/RAD55 family RecA-like ATPase